MDVPSVSVTSTSRISGMSCALRATTMDAAIRIRRGVTRVNAETAKTAKLLFVLRSSLAPGSLPGPRRAGCWFGGGGRARCAGGRGSLLRGRVAGGFQRGSTLDDPGEHPAGVAALRRPVRLPDGRRVFGEDVLEIALALHAAGGEFRDVE